jgi:hypothetical protein
VKEDPTASCGCPHAVACPQTAHSRRKGHLKEKKKGKSVGCFLGLFFCSLFFGVFFLEATCPGAKQTSSKAPAAPGIRSPAEAAGRFNRNPRGGRQTRLRDLLLRCSGCPVFCLRQAA